MAQGLEFWILNFGFWIEDEELSPHPPIFPSPHLTISPSSHSL